MLAINAPYAPNAGMLMGTWIKENAVRLIIVGIDLITALHEIK
jgi:hypothetical protein